MCIALCTIIAHNIAQNRNDNFTLLPSRQSPLIRWCLFEGRGCHRPPGRPCITWLNTVQCNLRVYNLKMNKKLIWLRTALCGGWCLRIYAFLVVHARKEQIRRRHILYCWQHSSCIHHCWLHKKLHRLTAHYKSMVIGNHTFSHCQIT